MPKKNKPERFKSLPFDHEAYAVDDALGVPRAAFTHSQDINTDAPENCWPCREWGQHVRQTATHFISGALTRYTFDFLSEADFSTGRGLRAELDRIEVYWKAKLNEYATKAENYSIELEEHAVLKTMLEGWADARDRELEKARIEKKRGATVSEEFFTRQAKSYNDKIKKGKAFLEKPGRKGRVPKDLLPDLACGRMVPLDPVTDNHGKWLKQVENAARRVCTIVGNCRQSFQRGHFERAMLFALDLGQAVAQAEVLLKSAPLQAGRTLKTEWTWKEAVEEARKIIKSIPIASEDLQRVGLADPNSGLGDLDDEKTLKKNLSAAASDGTIPSNGLRGKGGKGRRFSGIGVKGWILDRLLQLWSNAEEAAGTEEDEEEGAEEDDID